MLIEYDSLADFARDSAKSGFGRSFIEEMGFNPRNASRYIRTDFDSAVYKAIHGDDSLVPRAEELLNQLELTMPETRAFKTVNSPFGARVNLGDWLTGSPTPMRRRIRTTDDIAPIKVVVGVSCSFGIDAELMERRGIVILALVLKLQAIRPISLYLLTEDKGKIDSWHYHLIRIESNPLALGAASFGLCSESIERQLSYTLLHNRWNLNPAWPSDYESLQYWNAKRERLGLTEHDLLIREAYLTDPLINKPMDWLKHQLEKFTNTEEK